MGMGRDLRGARGPSRAWRSGGRQKVPATNTVSRRRPMTLWALLELPETDEAPLRLLPAPEQDTTSW